MAFDPTIIADANKYKFEVDAAYVSADVSDFPLVLVPPDTIDFYDDLAPDIHEDTVLLIESFNEADGSTDFEDSSDSGHTITAAGSTEHSTDESKFSSSSIYFDGTGDYLELADSSDWNFSGGESWTIRGWFRRGATGEHILFAQNDSSGANTSGNVQFGFEADHKVRIRAYDSSGSYKQIMSTSAFSSTSTWHHFEIVYDSTADTMYLFVAGSSEGSVSCSGFTFNNSSNKFVIGRMGEYDSRYYNGYLQGFEIIKGTALHTAAFTPPNRLFSVLLYKKISVDIDGTQCPVEVPPNEWEDWVEPTNHYTMDDVDGSTLTDRMGDTNGTITNMTQTSGGPQDGDYYLAGGSCSSVARNVDLGAGGISFKSVSIWFRRVSLTKYPRLLFDGTASMYFTLPTDSPSDALRIYDGSTDNTVTGLSAVTDTNWHHIVIVEGTDNDNHWVYLDGGKATSETSSNFGGLFRYFGRSATSAVGETPDLDNLQVFDSALTDAQVARLYAAESEYYHPGRQAVLYTKTPSTTASGGVTGVLSWDATQDDNDTYVGLTGESAAQAVWDSNFVAVYHLAQDPSGGTDCILDSTGNENHGTPAGGMTSADLVDADIGNGLRFSGTQWVDIGINETFDPITLETVCSRDISTGGEGFKAVVLGQDYSGATVSAQLRWHQDGSDSVRLSTYANSTGLNVSTTQAGTGEFRYIVGTRNGTSGGIQVDDNTRTTGTVKDTANTESYAIGGYMNQSAGFDGIISEVRISDIVRSDSWISLTNASLKNTLLTWSAYTSVETTEYMALCTMAYPLDGTLIKPVEQMYSLGEYLLVLFEQKYGLQLLALLNQYYSDAPVLRALLPQRYGDAHQLIRAIEQRYGDAGHLIQLLEQDWSLRDLVRALVEQNYFIAGEQHVVLSEQPYDLDQYQRLRRLLEQPYVMTADDATINRPTISVVTGDGVGLDPYHILIEADEAEYIMRGEIHLADQAQYLACQHLTEVQITVDDTTYYFIVESPKESEPAPGSIKYVVPLVSPTALLDAPYADTLNAEISAGQASAIVEDLAGSVSVTWEMVDWYIGPQVLYANNETPYAVIHKIVEAAGGVLQTAPDGSLICRAEYPISVDQWQTSTPDRYFTDQDNFYSVSPDHDLRDGFNRFDVSNEDTDDAGITIEEAEIDERTKILKVYQVPFDETSEIPLETSGGAWVSIVNEGIATESITEQVEIVGGEGDLTKPIYALTSIDYDEADLGTITIDDFDEDGHFSTPTAGNSLITITYQTKYRKFMVSDPRVEAVQFYPEAA